MAFYSLGEDSTYTSEIFISISLHLKSFNNFNGRDERLNRKFNLISRETRISWNAWTTIKTPFSPLYSSKFLNRKPKKEQCF